MSDSFAAPRTEVCQAALSMGFGNKDDIMLGFQISLALENFASTYLLTLHIYCVQKSTVSR